MPCFSEGIFMNSFTRFAGVIAALGLAQLASATPTLQLYQSGYSNGQGGEFTVIAPSLGVPAGYSPSATLTIGSTLGFQTFCVQAGQDDVYFTPGNTYTFGISNQILGGSMDPRTLNSSVAYLYSQFAQGTLAGYDYTNASGNRNADAGILQNEIWYLENELPQGTTSLGSFNVLSDLALMPVSGGNFGVQVLNLWDANGGPAQNQLVYTGGNVPDNGTTALLIGASLLALVLVSRGLKARSTAK